MLNEPPLRGSGSMLPQECFIFYSLYKTNSGILVDGPYTRDILER